MAERPRRSSGAVVGFVAGAVAMLVAVLLWSAWNRTRESGRLELNVAPAVPDLPAPRLPEAPRIPDAPTPRPK